MTLAGLVLLAPTAVGGSGVADYLTKPCEWFQSDEGRRITENILSHQAAQGGWPKNNYTTAQPFEGPRSALRGTFDNGATTDELRFLAKAWSCTRQEKLKKAFFAGLDHILQAQYPSGGWPQSYPPGKKYHRYITYNDNVVVRLMVFLREVRDSPQYFFVSADRKAFAAAAFDRGVACILRCQIIQSGVPTGWCAQHDEVDCSPRPGRSFELASISSMESVAITRLLMSLDQPSPEVIASVEGAIEWFRRAALYGIRVEKRKGDDERVQDLVVVEDPSAPDLWSRFYELETGRPLFCDRDGVPKYYLTEVSAERRGGYSWYGNWPQKLIEQEYPKWRSRWRN